MSLLSSDVVPRRAAPYDVTLVSTPRTWAALLILLLVVGVFAAIAPLAAGLLAALALYVIVEGPYEWLARRMWPGIAAGIIIVAALVLVIGPLAWLAMTLIDRAPGAVRTVLASSALQRVGELRIGGVSVGTEVAKMSGTIIGSLSGQLAWLLGTATSVTVNVVIALSGLYYLLRSSPGTWESVREYIPFSARTADVLRDRFVNATQATMLGTGVSAVVQGALIGLGFAITGLPEPVFWGIVAMFAATVPVIGSTLVWFPGVLVLAFQRQYGAAAGLFVISSVVAGNMEHFVRPLVNRRKSAIHPMITLVGMLAGIRCFGFIGILLGPLAILYLFELLRFYREEYVRP